MDVLIRTPEPYDGKLSRTVLMGGKLKRAYLSNQRLKPYQYLYVYYIYAVFFSFFKYIFFNKTVILKAPEGKRPKLEQVEGQLISAWKTEPVTVAIVSDDLGLGVKG